MGDRRPRAAMKLADTAREKVYIQGTFHALAVRGLAGHGRHAQGRVHRVRDGLTTRRTTTSPPSATRSSTAQAWSSPSWTVP